MVEVLEYAPIITGLLGRLTEHYVYPETAARICDSIRRNEANGLYRTAESPEALCRMLTEEMQAISNDKHLFLQWHSEAFPERGPLAADETVWLDQQRREALNGNNGFQRVERLPGNIGYLDIRSFVIPTIAGETAAAAMAFLAHTDALIVDVRDNLGGDGNMVTMLCTYFFDGIVQMSGTCRRASNELTLGWTMPFVPGRRYVGKPVYVLVNRHSYSGAELLAHELRALKRAILVGERTGGATHQALFFPITDHCEALISVGYLVRADGGAGWEGRGGVPNIACDGRAALEVAYQTALETLLDQASNPEQARQLREALSVATPQIKDPAREEEGTASHTVT